MSRKSQTLSSDLYLTNEEYHSFTSRLASMKPHDHRNITLLNTALYTGARASEVLAIRPRDLNIQTNQIYITGIKGSYDRELHIHDWLMKDLTSLIISPDQPLIFTIGYEQMRRIWFMYRPVKKKLHALRHTRAMRALEQTKDPLTVKFGLGHRSFQSTQVYLDHAISTQRAKAFLEE